ncbi:hypothetical protein ADEAN_000886000 [Angomonas deanei]|uniref:Uncharacterized protein n=1 Tax=Angomonas deanei TaxID=59799 RepID=A0A7G2CNA3_9TRYP|nr:hypothetical protein ADEAN_000886000 [Angomonas deanei]
MISKVVEEKMTDKNAFLFSRTAALMYRFMQLKKENYMDPFTGRGREQERCIRKLICGIVSRLLHLQSEAYGVCGESTVEFIEKPWTYAPFSSIALSFLTFPFDPVDTATLYRDEMVSRHFPRRPHILDACEEYPSGLTIVNEVLHPDRPCEVNMLNMLAVTKTPGMFVSSPSAVFSRSKEPVFSPDASGPRQSMSIQVKIDDAGSPSFYVGLASGMVTLRAPDMRSDTQGLFWTAKGTLRYQLSEYHFPPLFERDEISFDVFYLCDKWRIAVSMNHCELGVFDAPNVPLYLVAGNTDDADHHTLYKVFTRSLYGDEETGRAPSEEEEEESEVSRQDSASSRPDLSNVVALSTFEHQVVGVPKDLTARSSRYNFHAFSALILRYLSTKLSKQFLQHQREVGVGVNDEEVRRGAMVKEMLDSCSSRLLENADAVLKLVDSTENPLFTSEARKWRLLFLQ